jgi:hypothetical protein
MDHPTHATAADQAGERYAVQGILGRGGMAVVYDVTEIATGRKLALKRLQTAADPQKQLRNAELFEREFQALSQLQHPRIVEVYDYGIDALGAYYTMELIAGGDLQERSPLPWRTACGVARDVCSALSLLHSRRLVHRDVSPRNVRCTLAGPAKLIDFGAMAPLGSSKIIVGTPPCCAPESVHLQPLDGRTDLFSLGATLYYMLVGRHAYAARDFSLLSIAWQAGFARPIELIPDLPDALDALIVDLLCLEPDGRPANAAEVMQRLAAISGDEHAEQLQVAQAYLSMPTLLGREAALQQVGRRLKRVTRTRGRGRTIVIEGDPGVGRSRFLDACMLDAALLGAACARADADDAAAGDYGVLRALARQLRTVLPVATMQTARPRLAVLGHAIPELLEGNSSQPPPPLDAGASRAQLQEAVREWLTALCQRHAIIIAVDDLHRIDEPSAALLSLLAHDEVKGLCLLTSAETGAVWVSAPAQKLLLETAALVRLENLAREESESLLRSLFGDAPNIGMLAHRLHDLANGNPRDLLQLAQHLVDRQIVRYEAGAWTLPQRVDEADLPTSIARALHARLEMLSEPARELASAFALSADLGFSVDECGLLSGGRERVALLPVLDELVAADVARRVDERFGLSKSIWSAPLRAVSTPELELPLHARLARVLEARGSDFRAGEHWLHAGESARGLDVLVAHAAASQEETAKSPENFLRYAGTLPAHWFDTYEEALRLCDELDRPKREAFVLRARLVGIVGAFGVPDRGHVAVVLARLKHDSGLEDWETADPSLEPMARIEYAIQCAKDRHAATPERDRVLEPAMAMVLLARAVSSATGRVPLGLEVSYLRSLPVLVPFAPVSPGLSVLSKLVEGLDARYTGRTERARTIYQEVLDRTAQPDRAGLDGSYAELMRLGVMNGLGVIEACMGLASSLAWAEQTASHPAYQVNAVQTRMLHHLFKGDVRAADQCKKQVERLRLQTLQLYESSHLLWEIGAHAMAEDLTRLRHSLEQIAPLAQRYEPWKAVQYYARAEHHRIRRDPAQALAAIEPALVLAKPGLHLLWANIASTHVRLLLDLDRVEDALAAAEAYVPTAQQHDLGYVAEHLWMVLSLCQAHAGQALAAHTAGAVLERLGALGVQGLYLGLAHETRARVALLLDDKPAFARHAELCREIYCCHKNPALLAKYKRLKLQAERAERGLPAALEPLTSTPDSYASYTGMRIVHALAYCKGVDQRARLALTILSRQANASGGFMFTLGPDGPECIATVGDLVLPPSMEPRVTAFMSAYTEEAPTTSTDSQVAAGVAATSVCWSDVQGQDYRPVLLSHSQAGSMFVMGVALLAVSKSQPFQSPSEVASAISRFWADSADTSMLLLTH